MLFILAFSLVIASVFLIIYRKNKDSILWLGLCTSLMLELCGVMLFIAKKGGISQEVLTFLYFSRNIYRKMQYFLITLGQLGYLIAIGRSLFPFFLLRIAMNYSMLPGLRKRKTWVKLSRVIPIMSLILYFPSVYRMIVHNRESMQEIIAKGNMIWINLYLTVSVVILLIEYFSISILFLKRQFQQTVIFLVSISAIYLIYYHQDPGQVYLFYGYSIAWNRGIGYLQINPSLASYIMLVIVNIICAVLGFYSLFKYTKGDYEVAMTDVVMERKFDTVRVGVSMFVHSMKNQLLANKVIYKRIDQIYSQPEPDTVKLKECIDALRATNDTMFTRIEELYRSVKSNSITMMPVNIQEIIDTVLERFHNKFPDAGVRIQNEEVSMVLADKDHLCEAIYNLLINAEEAVIAAERGEDGQVCLKCRNERLYTLIEVSDNGLGMSKSQIKKIFDPFYSSKNSNYNWGMGLYYVREVVKSHLGKMRVESTEGKGSKFYILIPKYE